MQDNLGTSEKHDDNLIVVENNKKSSEMPSVENPYHENAKLAAKSKQNVNAMAAATMATTDKEISAIQLDCNDAVVSNLICDISNVQLTDDIDDYKNTAIMAPSPTHKSNSKTTSTSKRCKKCNCVCDKSTAGQIAPHAIKPSADCQRDTADGCATTNDVANVEPTTVTT